MMSKPEVMASIYDWKWYRLPDSQHLIEHPDFDERVRNFAAESLLCQHNHISTLSYTEESNMISGTLIGNLTDDPEDNWVFHYYINDHQLITLGDIDWLETRIDVEKWMECILNQKHPAEGLIFIINSFIRMLFSRMDQMEINLTRIEKKMEKNNGSRILKEVIDLRNQLNRWNLQTVALKEIAYALEESFPDVKEASDTCRIMDIYLKRIRMLQQNYEHGIDALLKVDDNIGNYRSNMIMKTLTVFTVLLTPMTALGAIWGMNFKNMPELDWTWGYAGALGLIAATTLITYLWLKSTGLTDDILKINVKQTNNEDEEN